MDNTYRIVKKEIPWKLSEEFKLAFFGDVHYDAEACDRDRFAKFIRQAREEGRHCFGMGDYFDFASAREQKALQSAGLHETTVEGFDGIVQERNRGMADKLKGVKVMGLIGGNHTWRLSSGYYADEDLAGRLQSEYLGWLCVYCIHFKFSGAKTYPFYIVMCHGKGGGRLLGTSINKVEELRQLFPFADLYVMGHDHQRGCWPAVSLQPKLDQSGFAIKEKRQYLIRSGSFMKSYQPDKSQYTTSGLMRPVDLGGVRLNVKFTVNSSKTSAVSVDIESIV